MKQLRAETFTERDQWQDVDRSLLNAFMIREECARIVERAAEPQLAVQIRKLDVERLIR